MSQKRASSSKKDSPVKRRCHRRKEQAGHSQDKTGHTASTGNTNGQRTQLNTPEVCQFATEGLTSVEGASSLSNTENNTNVHRAPSDRFQIRPVFELSTSTITGFNDPARQTSANHLGTSNQIENRRGTSSTSSISADNSLYNGPGGSDVLERHNDSFSNQVRDGLQLNPIGELSLEEQEVAQMPQQFQQQTQPTSDPPTQQLGEVSVRNVTRECTQGTSRDQCVPEPYHWSSRRKGNKVVQLKYEVPKLIQLAVSANDHGGLENDTDVPSHAPGPIVDAHMAQYTVSGQDSVMQDIDVTNDIVRISPRREEITGPVSVTNAAGNLSNFEDNSFTFFQTHDPNEESPIVSQSHSQNIPQGALPINNNSDSSFDPAPVVDENHERQFSGRVSGPINSQNRIPEGQSLHGNPTPESQLTVEPWPSVYFNQSVFHDLGTQHPISRQSTVEPWPGVYFNQSVFHDLGTQHPTSGQSTIEQWLRSVVYDNHSLVLPDASSADGMNFHQLPLFPSSDSSNTRPSVFQEGFMREA
ncbi:hypothetical protein RJ035_006645 [Blastomyces gilchristii]